MKFLKPMASLLLVGGWFCAFSQGSFYDLNTVQTVEIYFQQPNWDYQMDTAKLGKDEYTLAAWVKVNGVQYDSVGVKYKGNSSFDSTYKKNPVHIALDEFKDQSHLGMEDIKLSNGYGDPSMVREVLGYHILQSYMHAPKSNFAKLYINGKYIGLYSSAQNIDKSFCSEHFYSSKHAFFKCNPLTIPTIRTKSNLKYISEDSSAYANLYELKSDLGWSELIDLTDTISNYPTEIGKVLDIDRVLWMLAFNNVTVNLDSYSGVFSQNYYLYRDKTRHFNPIVWDLNMAFGGFPFLGNSNTSMGTLSIANMQQLAYNIHANDAYWPLIKAVLANDSYKRKYIAHMKTIVNEFFANGNYKTIAVNLQTLIKEDLEADTNKFFTDAQFANSLTQNYPFSSYSVPGLAVLMDARVTFLKSTAEFTAIAPTIDTVYSTVTYPALGNAVTILAKANNATSHILYYRFDKELKFVPADMFDDGTHGDGAAGDGVYGAAFTMSSNTAQYYVYAENVNAGTFSPARAEHEFYSIRALSQDMGWGDVVVNEFLASNKSGETNEKNSYEDWIELYNTTEAPIDLFGHHLSDTKNNLAKYTFPQNTIIVPKGYLSIWADENPNTTAFVHANFKLSTSGEAIYLTSASGTPIDSIVFGTQSNDISMGRCEDGIGAFTFLVKPTLGRANACSPTALEDNYLSSSLRIGPNPASEELKITLLNSAQQQEISVFNSLGHLVYREKISGGTVLNTTAWNSGVYLIKTGGESRKVVVLH